MEKLKQSRVAVFGVGGVGGYVIEALARCGIGTLDIVDKDVVDITNINRQIIATTETVGMPKVDVMEARIKSISPDTEVNKYPVFYLPEDPETVELFDFSKYNYVVDAIDTVSAKLDIIRRCYELGTPIISSMGCGNRLDPTQLVVTDIHKTEMDPLAKVMRKELRALGIKKLKVVYSKEQPIKPTLPQDPSTQEPLPPGKRSTPGSISFVPSAAGLIIASQVVQDLIAL